MSKRAVILAGGLGTRLKPYTVVLPKPLMPIGDYSIVEVVIRQLVQHGFNHITMAVNHHAKLIQAFFNNGEKWGVKIDYSIEDKPLSTMGPLKLINDLPENFLVMNGDILTNFNYDVFYQHHVDNKNIFTVAACQREQQSVYGVLEINKEGKLTGFKEKPTINYDISMGVYMLNKQVLEYIPEDKPYGFDNLMLELIRINKPAKVCKHDGYWLDIGNPDDYAQAIDEFEKSPERFLKDN